jgi:AcrR family transcriptional regulator
MALFSEHGYAATRIRDICDRAGVAKGLFYWYFPTKLDLFAELVRTMRRGLRRAQAAAMSSDADALTRLRQATAASVVFMAEHAAYFALVDVERADPTIADTLRAGSQVYLDDVLVLIREAQREGDIIDADPTMLAYGVLGAVSSYSNAWRAGRLDCTPEELAEFVAGWVVRALDLNADASADLIGQSGVACDEHRDEGVDDLGVELCPASRHDEAGRLGLRPCPLVRPLAAQRVVDVGDAHDPSDERDRGALDAERVPGAVPPLVVRLGDLGRHLEHRGRVAGEDAMPHRRVGLHHLVLLDRQRAGLAQHRVGHGDLADVVEAGREPELLAPLGRVPHRMGDLGGHVTDAVRVLAGLRIAELGEHGQLLERLEVVRGGDRGAVVGTWSTRRAGSARDRVSLNR